MNSHGAPADGNWDKYQKDIAREKGSLTALYNEHYGGSVYKLIEHCAEVIAYQYSVNRDKDEVIKSLLPERVSKGNFDELNK